MSRKAWINIRGLAIICVVLIHCTSTELSRSDANTMVNLFLNQISRFAVPIFLISSGFGLTLKKEYELPLKQFYFRRIKILPDYILWTLIYFFVYRRGNLLELAKSIITGNSAAHLYFIVLLIIFYVLYPVFYKLSTNTFSFILILLVNLIGQMIYQIFSFYKFPYFYNWMFFFCFGIFLAQHHNLQTNLKKYKYQLFISGLALVLTSCYISVFISSRSAGQYTSSMRPTVMIYSIGILSLFIYKLNIPNKMLAILDKNSMVIYYSHLLFLAFFKKFIPLFQSSNFLIILLFLHYYFQLFIPN